MFRILKKVLPVILALCVIGVIVVACTQTEKATKSPEETAAPVYQAWDYTIVRCEVDKGTNDIVCSNNGDYTTLANLLTAYGNQGWELSASFDPGAGSTSRSLIFKRERK